MSAWQIEVVDSLSPAAETAALVGAMDSSETGTERER